MSGETSGRAGSDRVAILRAGELVEVGTLAQMHHLSALSIDATFDAARQVPDCEAAVITKDRASHRTARWPARWVISGLTLQLVGVAGVAAYAWLKLRREGIGGHITAATIRLAWHADIHTRTGLAVLAAGAIIYAAGSVLMARPYLSRPVMLFVAVPIAAVVGMLALGVLALVVAILLAALANNADIPLDFGGGHGGSAGSSRRRKGT